MTNSTPAAPDVRMHGFSRRSEVPAVLEWIDRNALRLPSESVPLEQAAGRILATDLVSPLDVPGFDRAAMDGYALRGADTAGASEYNPLDFRVVGQSMPAQPFAGAIPDRAAIRIMTGAPVPPDVDSVIPAEYVSEANGQIAITRSVAPGQHVGHRGEDIREGAAALPAGRRLRAQDVGLIASLGLASVNVVRQPRVRLLVTGNEVRAPGTAKDTYEIYDANSYTLRGLVDRDGGVLESHQRLGDDPAVIRAALAAPGADVILVSGGSSVGSEDHAPKLVAELGELPIHGVAMRPSSPAGAGPRRRDARVPASRESGVLPLRVRFLRRSRASPARRPQRRLAASQCSGQGCPQDRLGDWSRRLLPRPNRRWRRRSDRSQRRIDALVDDARRRFRDRSRAKAKATVPNRSHRVPVRRVAESIVVIANARPAFTESVRRPDLPSRSSSTSSPATRPRRVSAST
jgi:molybdopterin molybdotransferase